MWTPCRSHHNRNQKEGVCADSDCLSSLTGGLRGPSGPMLCLQLLNPFWRLEGSVVRGKAALI